MVFRALVVVVAISASLGAPVGAGQYERTCVEPAVVFDEEVGMTAPVVTAKVDPKYPEEARKERAMGTVIVDAVIDPSGAVTGVSVLEDPDPRLSEAATEAIRQWRFDPATDSNGEAIAVCFVLTVKFKLQ